MSTTPPGPHTPDSSHHHPHQAFWLWVMCLTGVDYFSTLGYQPSIAVQNAGLLAPLATVVLVALTLFGAFPVYAYVARKSFEGQGSIGMLARLVSGWPGKTMVLILLGFAATDFVITKTMSASDAAVHLIENPNWPWKPEEKGHALLASDQVPFAAVASGAAVEGQPVAVRARKAEVARDDAAHRSMVRQRVAVTLFLLALLGGMFLKGFREVIGLAVVIVGTYLALNVVLIGIGIEHLIEHPDKFAAWVRRLEAGEWHLPDNPLGAAGGWGAMIAIALILFPKLALGLSGFETGVAVMSHVRGQEGDPPTAPVGRIRNTRKLLITAALIMSLALLGSSITVSALIDPVDITPVGAKGELPTDPTGKPLHHIEDWPKKPAAGRALAYLAHGEQSAEQKRRGEPPISPLFGPTFGTIYDLSTIVILWFAGASAMAGLLNLVPKYLPRYGMAPEWARATRPLVMLFTLINFGVTLVFKANPDAQGGAYATGVLVLMTSACVATVIDKYRTRGGNWLVRVPWLFVFITMVFVYTTIANEIEKNFQGLTIASFFIVTILVTSMASRVARSRELRFAGFKMSDPESRLLWDTIRHEELSILVPHRPGRRSLAEKERIIRREHRIPRDLMITFVQVELADPSEFHGDPVVDVYQEQGRYVVKISGAASIAHTLAAVALEMAKVGRPPEIHFGWTEESPVSGTLGFLLFGEGNVPWMVRELIHRAEPDEEKRPLIIIAGK